MIIREIWAVSASFEGIVGYGCCIGLIERGNCGLLVVSLGCIGWVCCLSLLFAVGGIIVPLGDIEEGEVHY